MTTKCDVTKGCNFVKKPAEMHAKILSDFIGPKVFFRDIERRDSDESFEPFRWRNNRRLPEKNGCKNEVE